MEKRIRLLIVGALIFSVFSLTRLNGNQQMEVHAEEVTSEVIASESYQTDANQNEENMGDKIKDEISNFKDTYLVPLLSGVSLTSVIGALFSLLMAFINRKNNKKSNEELIQSSKQVERVVELAISIIKTTTQIMEEIQTQNKIAENTRMDFQKSAKELLDKVSELTKETQALQKLKPIMVSLATIDSKMALSNANVIKNGLGEDISELSEQIKLL